MWLGTQGAKGGHFKDLHPFIGWLEDMVAVMWWCAACAACVFVYAHLRVCVHSRVLVFMRVHDMGVCMHVRVWSRRRACGRIGCEGRQKG